jgi:DNA-binding response OmpR family regulator
MNPPVRLLLVEDDRDIARLVTAQLAQEGYDVVVNATGGGVREQVSELEPQLILLDLMLPLAHGFEILRELRQDPRLRQTPVLVLTALGAESDRVRGLDLGADDYLTKPFSPRELAARVRARLRAAPPVPPPTLAAGPIELDLKARAARLRGCPLELSDTEFRLLAFLMQSPGQVFTRRQIVAAVWSPQHFITDRAVDVYMLRLRGKIEANPEQPRWLTSVRRVGYRFDPPAPA